jgi:hypothetical protein
MSRILKPRSLVLQGIQRSSRIDRFRGSSTRLRCVEKGYFGTNIEDPQITLRILDKNGEWGVPHTRVSKKTGQNAGVIRDVTADEYTHKRSRAHNQDKRELLLS